MDETILDKMLQMLYDHGAPFRHVNHDESIYKQALDLAYVRGLANKTIDLSELHIAAYSLTAAGIERVEAAKKRAAAAAPIQGPAAE